MKLKCKYCGKEIMTFTEAGPWVHAEDFAIDCYHTPTAEPVDGKEPDSVQNSD